MRSTHRLILCLWLVSCGGAKGKDEGCPAGFSADPGRQESVLARLRGSREGAAALARWGAPLRMCFGEAQISVVTERGALLMDASQHEARAAARVGHLVTHLADGLPALLAGEGECDERVERALAAEARALSLELRLLRELGAPPPAGGAWEVESVYWASPEKGREAAVLGYLRAHPDGAPGADALAAGYARRCGER